MQSFVRICEIIRELTGIPVESIKKESTARELSMDSLDMTEVILAVEEEFDVLVDDANIVESIGHIASIVDLQTQAA